MSGKQIFKLTQDELDDHDSMGICLACGETTEGVEPDAYGYDCESCGASKVCGIENAILMGRVEIVSDEDAPTA